MTQKSWERVQKAHCERINEDVFLEAELVYPAEFLPDQQPRVLAHRCSCAMECNQEARAACTWAGTNPGYDPFSA
jgi:hypothetical protein